MKRIAMVVVDRANWGRLEPLARAILNSGLPQSKHYQDFSLHIVSVAGVCDGQFGAVAHTPVHHVVAGDNLPATVRTIGHGVSEYANTFEHIRPGIVLVIGDRREALAAAIAAAHSGAKLVHLQGGETSGTLDQKYRWAITAMADYHVPATSAAQFRLERYIDAGGNGEILLAEPGCPSSDLAREVLAELTSHETDPICIKDVDLLSVAAFGEMALRLKELGMQPKPRSYRTTEVLVCYHPNTCHPETAAEEAEALFSALPKDRPITVLSTNPDAGRGPIVEACKRHGYAMVSLEPREFARRLATCSLAVGNSSGFVRDSGFYGTPVVLVGDRQNGRERSENVMQVACVKGEIEAGIEWQLEHGPYPPSDLYGDGRVCERIVEALKAL